MKKRLIKLLALTLCVGLIMGLAACGNGNSQNGGADEDYPNKAITMIIPYGPGGGSDIMGRIIAANMDLGVPIVVQNVAGGSTFIGAMEAYEAKPDGYTIHLNLFESMMCMNISGVYAVPVHEGLVPIGNVVYDGSIICTAKNSKFQTLDDIVKYAKENPGDLQWASVATMGNNQLGTAQLSEAAGIEVNYVPYENASESRTAVMGGHADVVQGAISESKPYIDSGELTPIAVWLEERSSLLPNVPTLKELGYDVVNGLHRGFFAPPGTPDEIIAVLEDALKEAFDKEEVFEKLQVEQGAEMVWMTSSEVSDFFTTQFPKFKSAFDLIQ